MSHARKPATVLLVVEEALHHRPLAGVVGEFSGALGLTASRRLQLAAEHSGVTAFLLRRSRRFDDPALLAPSAAATRWRVVPEPSPPPLPHAPETPGLGPPALAAGPAPLPWRRGRMRGSWRRSMRRVVSVWLADLADRSAAPESARAAA